jgi:hypothetical protein
MREHHSASSVTLIRRCQRAAAYQYLDGLREPDVTWADVEAGVACTSGQRSRALGKAVHAHLEAWQRGTLDSAAWATTPGTIALSGAHLVPAPGTSPGAAFEREFRKRVGAVEWLGCVDAHFPAAKPPLIVDYKTSRDIARYALTPDQLAQDLQASLYAAALGTGHVRWVYLQTGRARRARAVDVAIALDDALATVEAAAEDARAFDSIARSSDAPQNPRACAMFGGCPYHHSRGGPCDVRTLPSAFTKEAKMPLTLDKIEELKRAAAGATPAPKAAPDAAPARVTRKRGSRMTAPTTGDDAGDDAGDDTEATPAPARKRRAKRSPEATPAPLAPSGVVDAVLAAQDELREACAEVDAATQRRDAIVARIGELCSR